MRDERPVWLLAAIAAIALWSAGGAPIHGQQESRPNPIGTATLAGRVVDHDGDRPLGGFRVTLNADGNAQRPARETLTDTSGNFRFPQIPAGTYQVSASSPAWLTSRYGQKKPNRIGMPITVADRQTIGDLVIRMFRGGVISGQVTGANAQPLVGVVIEAMRLRYDVDGRLLDEANGAANTKTDDRGQYRIFGLTPGEYLVRASPPTGSSDYFNDAALDGIQQLLPTGYASMYLPNAFAPGQAAPIELGAGEERLGVDFPLTPLPLANIHGILMGPAGPVSSAQFYRLDDDGLLHNGERMLAATGGDGRFVIFGLPPGLIGLRARAYPQRSPGPAPASMSEGTLWGTARIAVAGKDVTGVTIAMQPGITVRGVVKTESAEANVSLAGASVAVRPASSTGLGQGEILVGKCDPEGRFAIGGVPSGSYHLLLVNAPAKWTVMSITRDGVDALSAPMDVSSEDLSGIVITLTDHPASLSGALRSEGGGVVADYTVIAFPANPAQRATRAANVYAARPGNDGRFSVPFVAPGEYLIAVTDDIEPNAWFDPRVLERLAATGIRVTVAKGEAKVQDLQLRGGR